MLAELVKPLFKPSLLPGTMSGTRLTICGELDLEMTVGQVNVYMFVLSEHPALIPEQCLQLDKGVNTLRRSSV